MKKTLTRTIIVFVTLNLITAGFTLAQNVAEGKSQSASKEELIAEKEAEIARMKADIAAKVAQREAEFAQKEIETKEKQLQAQLKQLMAAQKQVELQIPKIEVAAPRIPLLGDIPLLGHGGGGAVLVIPAAEMKIENLAAVTEDMSVMSRIFDNKLSQAHLTTGRTSWYVEDYNPFLGRDSGTIEAVYLEGYAALFLMKVNFPLSPLPEEKEEKETEEEDTDPLWTQMRQEIFAPEEVDRLRRRTDRPEEKYDAEKVEELKETLIKTLKHAVNIRALKPDQSMILTVIGGRSQSGTRTTTPSYGQSSGALDSRSSRRGRSSYITRRGRSSYITTTPGGAESGSFLPTVLTICAKKSDIDDFAKGELSFDQFRERTKIFASYAKFGSRGLPGVQERPVAQARPSVF